MAHRRLHFTISIFILLTLAGLIGCAGRRHRQPEFRQFGMQAVADTLVTPDRVVWRVTMSDSDNQLAVAKAASDAKLEAIMAAIDQAAGISRNPVKGQACINRRQGLCVDGKTLPASFEVRRQVMVYQNDPEAVEDLLDRLIQAADVEVSYHFEVSDREAIMRRLRGVALDRARTRAADLVARTGHVLGKVVHVSVNEDFDGWRERMANSRGSRDAGPRAKSLHTQVNVGYLVD